MKNYITTLTARTKTIKRYLAQNELPKYIEEVLTDRLKEDTRALTTLQEKEARDKAIKLMEETTSEADLIQRYANALVTGLRAGGHGKSESNHAQANYWLEVINRRGFQVPDRKLAYAAGEFNGTGSV